VSNRCVSETPDFGTAIQGVFRRDSLSNPRALPGRFLKQPIVGVGPHYERPRLLPLGL
jgi:hypothetical protein